MPTDMSGQTNTHSSRPSNRLSLIWFLNYSTRDGKIARKLLARLFVDDFWMRRSDLRRFQSRIDDHFQLLRQVWRFVVVAQCAIFENCMRAEMKIRRHVNHHSRSSWRHRHRQCFDPITEIEGNKFTFAKKKKIDIFVSATNHYLGSVDKVFG